MESYEEFLERILRVVKRENSYRLYAILPISVRLAEEYIPSSYWTHRRKNRRHYCRYFPLPNKRTLILGTHQDRFEFLGDIHELLDLVDPESVVYGRLTKGCSIDDYYLLRREGKRLYIQPHPKQVHQFWIEQEKILNTTKFWKPAHAIYRINKIRADFYKRFKNVYIPIEQLKGFDRRLQKKLFKWLGSHKYKKNQQYGYWKRVFKFSEAENVFSKFLSRQAEE
jgi:hypothetical protein